MIGTQKRPATNRKVSSSRSRRQQHLMEVKVRRETARRQNSRKVFGLLFRMVFFTLIVGGIYYGVREGLSHFLFENPEYELREVEVQVVGDLTRTEVLEVAQVKDGTNIFSIDLAAISRRVEALSQVEEVQVERILPNKLSIHVEERRPIAWAVCIGQESNPFADPRTVMIDPRGYVLPRSPKTDYVNLPMIWVQQEILDVRPGVRIDDMALQSALALLQKVQTAPIGTRFVIQEIDLSKEFCLVARDRSKMSVMFGFDEMEEQLAKLSDMLEHFDAVYAKPATINLMVRRNTPVTFTENILPAEPVASPSPGTKEPASSRSTPKDPPIRRAVPVKPNEKRTKHG